MVPLERLVNKKVKEAFSSDRIFNFQALVVKNTLTFDIWTLQAFELDTYTIQELFNLCYLHNDFEFLKRCLTKG